MQALIEYQSSAEWRASNIKLAFHNWIVKVFLVEFSHNSDEKNVRK